MIYVTICKIVNNFIILIIILGRVALSWFYDRGNIYITACKNKKGIIVVLKNKLVPMIYLFLLWGKSWCHIWCIWIMQFIHRIYKLCHIYWLSQIYSGVVLTCLDHHIGVSWYHCVSWCSWIYFFVPPSKGILVEVSLPLFSIIWLCCYDMQLHFVV